MHTKAQRIVQKMPVAKPAFLNAMGIARIPVPSDAFSKCVRVSPSLKNIINKSINAKYKK